MFLEKVLSNRVEGELLFDTSDGNPAFVGDCPKEKTHNWVKVREVLESDPDMDALVAAAKLFADTHTNDVPWWLTDAHEAVKNALEPGK